MNVKTIIQHVVSILIFVTSVVFGLLKIFGVAITINESEINSIIFGLGSIIAACIEAVPFIKQLIKDRDISKILTIVNDVVKAVEELKGLSGKEKKAKALYIISRECFNKGLEIETVDIDEMIESVVALRNKVVK